MAYSDKLLDHFRNPRNAGVLDRGDRDVGTGLVGSPAQGSVMRLQIRVSAQDVVEDARFKTYGGAAAIACTSLVTAWLKGKTLAQATAIEHVWIADELALPPEKIHCSVQAVDAIKAAIDDYLAKRPGCDAA